MPNNPEIEQLISVSNQQKGELLFQQTLLVSLFRAMPSHIQTDALNRFDQHAIAVRDAALFASADDEILEAFEYHVRNVDKLLLKPVL